LLAAVFRGGDAGNAVPGAELGRDGGARARAGYARDALLWAGRPRRLRAGEAPGPPRGLPANGAPHRPPFHVSCSYDGTAPERLLCAGAATLRRDRGRGRGTRLVALDVDPQRADRVRAFRGADRALSGGALRQRAVEWRACSKQLQSAAFRAR